MEQTVLEILDDNIDSAQDEKLKQLFRHHHDETKQHIANLEQVFAAFDWDVDDSPCPAIEAIQKEGKTNVKKTDDALVDSVILQGAVETEHHEIGVYENLIINAEAMGRDDCCARTSRSSSTPSTRSRTRSAWLPRPRPSSPPDQGLEQDKARARSLAAR